MDEEHTKFYTSIVAIKVASVGAMRLVRAWNAHTIPGNNGGIPSELAGLTVLEPLSEGLAPLTGP